MVERKSTENHMRNKLMVILLRGFLGMGAGIFLHFFFLFVYFLIFGLEPGGKGYKVFPFFVLPAFPWAPFSFVHSLDCFAFGSLFDSPVFYFFLVLPYFLYGVLVGSAGKGRRLSLASKIFLGHCLFTGYVVILSLFHA